MAEVVSEYGSSLVVLFHGQVERKEQALYALPSPRCLGGCEGRSPETQDTPARERKGTT